MTKSLLNIIILGPQGSGKGTQAERLEQRLHLEHIETGQIFRTMAGKNNALGIKINNLINLKGRLLTTEFVIKILQSYLSKVPKDKGLIFDGYPRNLTQARALDRLLRLFNRRLTHVIYLPISRGTTLTRLVRRRTCRHCNRKFILGVNLKKGATICPNCGGEIYQREDDKPRAISRRLSIYLKQTKPLIKYYKKQGILITIDGEPPIPVVSKNILKYFS